MLMRLPTILINCILKVCQSQQSQTIKASHIVCLSTHSAESLHLVRAIVADSPKQRCHVASPGCFDSGSCLLKTFAQLSRR